ncbi:MAG TPA: hypothetical protein VE264_03755 [Nitrososphaera sp.]|nr:hypothetical protein [Nitrososphaera sp.]
MQKLLLLTQELVRKGQRVNARRDAQMSIVKSISICVLAELKYPASRSNTVKLTVPIQIIKESIS